MEKNFLLTAPVSSAHATYLYKFVLVTQRFVVVR
jgi:hypothetical protein